MSRIHVLSDDVSNRIAAGEVIERPASVVKELVENGLDAGASHLRVAVENAGRKLISVTDDGCGMDRDDALLALEIHGTSKISDAEDLDAITSLGFRGEAVPSIASVSRFTLTTRERGALEGVEVRVDGGKVLECRPAGGAPGTRVEVRDLFYNTPARKKFLKADATEMHHIEEMLTMLALCHPEVSFALTSDGREVFSTPGAKDLGARVALFFGRNYAASMTPVYGEESGLSVTGFAAVPGFARNTRREQRTFVNGRPVESPALYRGIREGYGVMPGHGSYPPVILFVALNPSLVDVNVHPAKREVRFRSENTVTRVVASAILRSLAEHDEAAAHSAVNAADIPTISRAFAAAEVRYAAPESEAAPELPFAEPAKPVHAAPVWRQSEPSAARPPATTDRAPDARPIQEPPREAPAPLPEAGPEREAPPVVRGLSSREKLPESPIRFPDIPENLIGILADTYLLCQGANGDLVLVDQHAAHERILFESLLPRDSAPVPRQALLLPALCELPRASVAFLNEHIEELKQLGFELEPLSSNSVLLSALPSSFPEKDAAELLSSLAANLFDEVPDGRGRQALEAIARAACHAAVKAHDVLTPDEGRLLLKQLARCRQGRLCPHGRPTVIAVTLSELEKKFGRK